MKKLLLLLVVGLLLVQVVSAGVYVVDSFNRSDRSLGGDTADNGLVWGCTGTDIPDIESNELDLDDLNVDADCRLNLANNYTGRGDLNFTFQAQVWTPSTGNKYVYLYNVEETGSPFYFVQSSSTSQWRVYENSGYVNLFYPTGSKEYWFTIYDINTYNNTFKISVNGTQYFDTDGTPSEFEFVGNYSIGRIILQASGGASDYKVDEIVFRNTSGGSPPGASTSLAVNAPANYTNVTGNFTVFNVTVTSGDATTNVTFLVNGSVVHTNGSVPSNESYTYNYTAGYGLYSLDVWVNATDTNITDTEYLFQFLAPAPPTYDDYALTINAPVNYTHSTNSFMVFNVTVTSDEPTTNVSFLVDGVIVHTNGSVVSNASYSYNHSGSPGSYLLTVYVNGTGGNVTDYVYYSLTETFYTLSLSNVANITDGLTYGARGVGWTADGTQFTVGNKDATEGAGNQEFILYNHGTWGSALNKSDITGTTVNTQIGVYHPAYNDIYVYAVSRDDSNEYLHVYNTSGGKWSEIRRLGNNVVIHDLKFIKNGDLLVVEDSDDNHAYITVFNTSSQNVSNWSEVKTFTQDYGIDIFRIEVCGNYLSFHNTTSHLSIFNITSNNPDDWTNLTGTPLLDHLAGGFTPNCNFLVTTNTNQTVKVYKLPGLEQYRSLSLPYGTANGAYVEVHDTTNDTSKGISSGYAFLANEDGVYMLNFADWSITTYGYVLSDIFGLYTNPNGSFLAYGLSTMDKAMIFKINGLPGANGTAIINARDSTDNTSIDNFTVLFTNGTAKTTTNGSIYLYNANGDYNFTIYNVSGGNGAYFNLTARQWANSTGGGTNTYYVYPYQSIITLQAYYLVTNTSATGVTYEVNGTQASTFYLKAGNNYYYNASKTDYYDLTGYFDVAVLDNKTVNVFGLYNARVLISPRDYLTNATINDTNITITLGAWSNSSTTVTNATYNLTTGTYNLQVVAFNRSVYNESVTISATGESTYYAYMYPYNTVVVYAFDQGSGSGLSDFNVTIENANNTYTNVTTTGSATITNIVTGSYDVTVSAPGYQNTASYSITVTNNSFQTLNAYLTNTSGTFIFTVRDASLNSLLAGVTILQQRVINGSLSTVESHVSDITGRAQFTYTEDLEYTFIASRTGYNTRNFTLEEILFSTYTVLMYPTVTLNESVYIDDVGISMNGHKFTSAGGLSYFSLIFDSDGHLEDYFINITSGFNSTYISGSTADGSTLNASLNITGAVLGDQVTVIYGYKSDENDGYKYFTRKYNILDFNPGAFTLRNARNYFNGHDTASKFMIASLLGIIFAAMFAFGSLGAGGDGLTAGSLGGFFGMGAGYYLGLMSLPVFGAVAFVLLMIVGSKIGGGN